MTAGATLSPPDFILALSTRVCSGVRGPGDGLGVATGVATGVVTGVVTTRGTGVSATAGRKSLAATLSLREYLGDPMVVTYTASIRQVYGKYMIDRLHFNTQI